MQISRLWIENYRAVSSIEVTLGDCTVLLGENNAGKSTILSGLNLFFDSAPKVEESDFHHNDTSAPIKVTVEFVNLVPDEYERYEGKLIDNALRVAREFHLNDPAKTGRFFVEADVNPEFAEIRSLTKASDKRAAYSKLRESQPELGLNAVRNADEIDDQLERWESENPDNLKREFVSGLGGWKNVAIGQLREKTELVFVPAVKDTATELGNEKSSPVKKLLNTIAKQTIENSEEFKAFKQAADTKLKQLTSPDNVSQLAEISSSLTEILSRYYDGSELVASWSPVSELPISYPTSELTVKDHDFVAPLEKVGHGLQRAILLSVVEFIARDANKPDDESTNEFGEAQSDIILVVEEPEIFQHPIKQRLFRSAFKSIADGYGKSTGIRIQVIYTTHSALMVDIKDFDEICLMRRESVGGIPFVTSNRASLKTCAEKVGNALGVEPDETIFRAGLHIFTESIAEGFFAKKVVLVEGVADQAILQGLYTQLGRNPLAEGIHIVNAEGKKKFHKPIVIFGHLGIPVYFLFDNDEHNQADAEFHHLLQKIVGIEQPEDFPAGCSKKFAAFDGHLEAYLKSVVGEPEYNARRTQVGRLLDIKPKDTLKNPTAAKMLFEVWNNGENDLSFLMEVVSAIDEL